MLKGITVIALYLNPIALRKYRTFDPIALRKAKIVCNFGLPECNRVKCSIR